MQRIRALLDTSCIKIYFSFFRSFSMDCRIVVGCRSAHLMPLLWLIARRTLHSRHYFYFLQYKILSTLNMLTPIAHSIDWDAVADDDSRLFLSCTEFSWINWCVRCMHFSYILRASDDHRIHYAHLCAWISVVVFSFCFESRVARHSNKCINNQFFFLLLDSVWLIRLNRLFDCRMCMMLTERTKNEIKKRRENAARKLRRFFFCNFVTFIEVAGGARYYCDWKGQTHNLKTDIFVFVVPFLLLLLHRSMIFFLLILCDDDKPSPNKEFDTRLGVRIRKPMLGLATWIWILDAGIIENAK